MPWYFFPSYFVGGAFLANSIPHLVNGISGRSFPTPFASPPGRGLSSPLLNVLWAAFSVVIGYLLAWQMGDFTFRSLPEALAFGIGALLTAVMLAVHFGRVFSAKA